VGDAVVVVVGAELVVVGAVVVVDTAVVVVDAVVVVEPFPPPPGGTAQATETRASTIPPVHIRTGRPALATQLMLSPIARWPPATMRFIVLAPRARSVAHRALPRSASWQYARPPSLP
jgi:hypothetical protein